MQFDQTKRLNNLKLQLEAALDTVQTLSASKYHVRLELKLKIKRLMKEIAKLERKNAVSK